MGHSNVNDIYRKPGKKIDGTTTRVPWNQSLYEILKALYTPREAELLVKMPYSICCFEQIAQSLKFDQAELHTLLERGTRQNQLFNDPQSISHKFLLGFLGDFLFLSPIKQALMSDLLRSRFLTVLKAGAQKKYKK